MDSTALTTPERTVFTSAYTSDATVNTSYTWKDVTAGMHNFTAELVNNDDTTLDPAKYATINVIVTETAAETSVSTSSGC